MFTVFAASTMDGWQVALPRRTSTYVSRTVQGCFEDSFETWAHTRWRYSITLPHYPEQHWWLRTASLLLLRAADLHLRHFGPLAAACPPLTLAAA